jgi:hypothetical protein
MEDKISRKIQFVYFIVSFDDYYFTFFLESPLKFSGMDEKNNYYTIESDYDLEVDTLESIPGNDSFARICRYVLATITYFSFFAVLLLFST